MSFLSLWSALVATAIAVPLLLLLYVLRLRRRRLRMPSTLLWEKSFEDLQNAIRSAATARRDDVDQRFAFASALVDLYEAAGIVAERAGLGASDASLNDEQ